MRNLFAPCGNLNPVASIAAVAFVAVAVFAWAEKTTILGDGMDTNQWLWRAWQLGALIIALAGVWMAWLSTRRAAWVRSLALGIFTLAVFANTYSDAWFGDYSDEVWLTINPLFIAFSSVAAVSLWRCGCAAGRIGAATAVVLGVAVFVNAYFTNNGIVWQIMDPLMMLAALAWAAGALKAEVAEPRDAA
jgi:hypothetical protein